MTVAPPRHEEPLAEQLTFLYEARAAAAVLEASERLGVLHRLDRGPVDAATLAEECHIGRRAARALLLALAGLGLAEPDGQGAYRAAACDLVGFMELLRPWEGLADGLRRSSPEATGSPGSEQEVCRRSGHLATLFAPAALAAAEHLAAAGGRVVDLRTGSAVWSLALAARDPSCVVTAVDLPAGLETTREVAAAAGCQDRFRFVEGDPLDVELEAGAFDLVIAGNLCHLFDESTNQQLLARAARWLAPGGTVAVIDILSNERRDGPRVATLYAAGLVPRTVSGEVYPFSAFAGWLRTTGFEGVERIELSSYPPFTLVRARRA